jgi:short-subunit dehydrogenase
MQATNKQVALITGASSGIGQETARVLASRGYRVFGTTRASADVTPIRGVEMVPLDVCDDASVNACVQGVLRLAGRVDVLVNNAGRSLFGAVEETQLDESRALFETNVFGVLRMIRAVLPDMRQRRSGLIVNMSSVLGFLPAPFMGLYASSKHALEGLSESLDHEVRSFGIRIVLIEPNFTATQFGAHTQRVARPIDAYRGSAELAYAALVANITNAPGPADVASEIVRAIESSHRMRRPAGGRARLLSRLRRFMPAGPVDASIRRVFGLS